MRFLNALTKTLLLLLLFLDKVLRGVIMYSELLSAMIEINKFYPAS